MLNKAIALIPARSGSKRVKNKNVKILGGHPLIAFTISCALKSKIFDRVIIATDDEAYAEIGERYGANVPFLRNKSNAEDTSPDIDWVTEVLDHFEAENKSFDFFSILRPTSPFRSANTIQRAWKAFKNSDADSLRAVELCKQHPGKMWKIDSGLLKPLFDEEINGTPWHSNQYSSLPEIYVQNASLEIAKTKVLRETKTISGNIIAPFFTEGLEGFDINSQEDWDLAEKYVEEGLVGLPRLNY